jgi:Phage protein U
MFVLMALGSFRFSIDTFAYEELRRKTHARIQPQDVIGAAPSLHYMGPGVHTLSITSVFFPWHLPGNRGLEQANAMRAACGQSFQLVASKIDYGEPLGRWALLSIDERKTEIHPNGEGQKISLEIELMFDPAQDRPDIGSILSKLNLFG